MHEQKKLAVAVIMSVYKSDSLDYVCSAIESLFAQDYKKIKIYLFKDGDLNNDVEVYLSSVEIQKKLLILRSDKNIGLASALNKLIDELLKDKNYEFIARMDSDDISKPSRISKQVKFMAENPEIDVCGTSCHEFGAEFAMFEKHLPTEHSNLLDLSITRCPFIHPTVMFRRRVFESGVRYPVSTSLTEDMALWFELLEKGYIFGNVNEILLDYRLNKNTIKRRKGFKKAISEISIRIKYMILLKRVTAKNIFLIMARMFFHLMPEKLMILAYKKAR